MMADVGVVGDGESLGAADPSATTSSGRTWRLWRYDRSALKSAGTFLAFAIVWILISDAALETLVQDHPLAAKYQTYKGIAFVACTAALVYALAYIRSRQFAAAQTHEQQAAITLRALKDRRDLAFAAAHLGEWSYDRKQDRFTYDERAARHFGIASGASMFELLSRVHADDRTKVEKLRREASDGRTLPHTELRLRQKDGTFSWIAVSVLGKQVADETEISEFIGTCQDINERKLAVQEALDKASLLRTATDTTGIGLVVLDRERRYTFANPAYSRILGVASEILGRSPRDVMPESYDQQIKPRLDLAFAGERVIYELLRGDKAFSVIYEPMLNPRAQVDSVVVVIVETTELRRSEQALRESEQRLNYVMATTGEGVWDWEISTSRVEHNAQWLALLGLDETYETHGPETFVDLIHEDDRAEVRRRIKACITKAVPYVSEHRVRRSDGEYIWVLDRGDVVTRDAAGRALRMVGSFCDISDRKRAEQRRDQLMVELVASEAASHRQKALFKSVFESTPDGLVIADNDRKIVRINPALSKMFGYSIEDLAGRSTLTLYSSNEDFDAVGRQLDNPDGQMPLVNFARANGEVFPVSLTATPMHDEDGTTIGYLGIIRDVTNDLKREAALREKQRLEALGRLSGGIAHDFNNLLTVITGNLQLIELETDDPAIRPFLGEANRAAEMGARLNQRLMTFASQRRLDPVTLDVNEIVNSLKGLMTRSIGEEIQLQISPSQEPAMVLLDPSELENAIINLLFNARDAMPEGGRLSLSIRHVVIPFEEADKHDVAHGRYVQFSVSDTGIGMSAEIRGRAFEPFFTTKTGGRGSGLGLTTIHGFVKQSGGYIDIDSTEGRGTTVSLYLPSSGSAPCPLGRAKVKAEMATGNGEHILVVEDDAAVLRITCQRLRTIGYNTLEALSGEAALVTLGNSEKVDLVLSDINMAGGMSGLELARQIRALRPALPVLLTSGLPQSLQDEAASDQPTVLAKPYSLQQMADAIAKSLACAVPLTSL